MKNILKISSVALATANFLFLRATSVFARTDLGTGGGGLPVVPDVPNISDLAGVLVRVITVLFGVAGGFAIVMLIIGGLKYMAAGGDPKSLDTARKSITYPIIGLVIILLSTVMVVVIGNILGVKGIGSFDLKLQSPTNFSAPGNSQDPCLNVRPGQPC